MDCLIKTTVPLPQANEVEEEYEVRLQSPGDSESAGVGDQWRMVERRFNM